MQSFNIHLNRETSSFIFSISFRDIFEYHRELPLSQIERKLIRKKLEERGGLDLTFIESLKKPSEYMANVLTKTIKKKNIKNIRKGDVINLDFITDMQYGFYFWDGVKVILPERDEKDGIPSYHMEDNYVTELYRIPSVFKIPSDFPIHYWQFSTFVGLSNYGDFYYDTSDLSWSRNLHEVHKTLVENRIGNDIAKVIIGYLNFTLEECVISESLLNSVGVYKDNQTGVHIIMEEEKGTMERFVNTGRCFSALKGEKGLSHCLTFTDSLFRIFDEDQEALGNFFNSLINHISHHGEDISKSIFVSYHGRFY